ncbi:diguanylate cyclase [Burkholderiales bacterium GJ-E10]|nr:diguanylate cyclase [Burkholderiales bacterium GJ-E10]
MLDDSSEDLALNTDLLKKTIPLMTRHAAGYYPISYALWYEYAKGDRSQLREAVDADLAQRGRLTTSATYALYVQHIVEPAERMIFAARANLMEMLGEIQRNTAQTGQNASEFDLQLAQFQEKLSSATSMDDLASAIVAMQAGAGKMGEDVRQLSGQLEQARNKIRSLTEKVDKLQSDVVTDALSGLLNRRGFNRELELASKRTGADAPELSLIMIDIDHFKRINDTYGHPFGDRVIAAIGNAIHSCVNTMGVAARYGGEEFAVLLPSQPVAVAETVAQAIRARVEQGRIRRRTSDEPVASITISAGVASWEIGDNVESLVERADQALYISKREGRNRVTIARAAQ